MENDRKLKKLGTSLLCGLVFGLAAGMVIIIILAVFPQNFTVAGQETEPSVQIQAGKETSLDGDKANGNESNGNEADGNETDGEQAYEGNTMSGGNEEIQAAGSTDESQTIVTDVTTVVDHVMPCVVSIFGTYQMEDNYWGYQYDYEAEGSGSGIIVGENDSEILIATNNHVVEDSTELSVQFIDEAVADAQIKGTNRDTDLAVIAVSLDELDPSTKETIRLATLGDSNALKVGEPAIAIGNALGYGQSVTTGVISAVNRAYSDDEDYYGSFSSDDLEDVDVKYLIQTDAAINPGNSGGALLNARGEVVGINSNKIAGDTVEGMGYAIPISTAKPIIEELMAKKTRTQNDKGERAYLGVSGIAVTEDMQKRNNIPAGLYITQVFSDTPARKAGIEKGDILVSLDGDAITSMDDLSDLLLYLKKGAKVQAKILKRSNNGYVESEVTVTLGGKR